MSLARALSHVGAGTSSHAYTSTSSCPWPGGPHNKQPPARGGASPELEKLASPSSDLGCTRVALERLYRSGWPKLRALDDGDQWQDGSAFYVSLDDKPQKTKNVDKVRCLVVSVPTSKLLPLLPDCCPPPN